MDGWDKVSTKGGVTGGGITDTAASPSLADVKARIHRKLLGRLNLTNLESVTREEATQAIRQTIADGDRLTLDLGGSASTQEYTDAVIERL